MQRKANIDAKRSNRKRTSNSVPAVNAVKFKKNYCQQTQLINNETVFYALSKAKTSVLRSTEVIISYKREREANSREQLFCAWYFVKAIPTK